MRISNKKALRLAPSSLETMAISAESVLQHQGNGHQDSAEAAEYSGGTGLGTEFHFWQEAGTEFSGRWRDRQNDTEFQQKETNPSICLWASKAGRVASSACLQEVSQGLPSATPESRLIVHMTWPTT